ncbi:hypothetical protein CUS95_08930 [Enterococcus faecium]|nr:hypothetical protein CG820_03970 [Enterococcus faecium]PQF02669.1 hypothetical protein CUS95_08930 [Enterococcus faecium]PQF20494.1 hypothetical protein CUS93_12385 [Enterococcus faecium]PQG63210.1 hypothetical protein CUS28_09130 [Enterococcus faecium]
MKTLHFLKKIILNKTQNVDLTRIARRNDVLYFCFNFSAKQLPGMVLAPDFDEEQYRNNYR